MAMKSASLDNSALETLGKGRLIVAANDDWADASNHALGRKWQDFMHIKEFKITTAVETLEHENFSGGIKRVDKTAIKKQSAKFSGVCDAMNIENVLAYMLGESVTTITQSSGSLSSSSMTVQELGKWQEILDGSGNRVYNLSGISVQDSTPTTLVEDDDYVVSETNGLIMFLDGTNAVAAADVVTINATIPADAIKEIEGGTQPQQKRHIWFMGDPAEGVVQQVQGWGLIVPSGDISMIGDDWESFNIEGNFLSHSDYGALGFKYRELGIISG